MPPLFALGPEGTRKGGTSAHTGAKIESWRAIFSPWESPWSTDGSRYGCWQCSIFSLTKRAFFRDM